MHASVEIQRVTAATMVIPSSATLMLWQVKGTLAKALPRTTVAVQSARHRWHLYLLVHLDEQPCAARPFSCATGSASDISWEKTCRSDQYQGIQTFATPNAVLSRKKTPMLELARVAETSCVCFSGTSQAKLIECNLYSLPVRVSFWRQVACFVCSRSVTACCARWLFR